MRDYSSDEEDRMVAKVDKRFVEEQKCRSTKEMGDEGGGKE